MNNILDNTICFTHGGTLAGLYGILVTNTLSSNNSLEQYGDSRMKFTDPENIHQEEDSYLFFESMADRGLLKYSGFVQGNAPGFSFLLVASSHSLLNQVDMLGNSDGILMGKSSLEPLDIDLEKVDYKILVPDIYQEEVQNYCTQLKQLGFNPREDLLVFKSFEELDKLTKCSLSHQALTRQEEFCRDIGLNAKKTEKKFKHSEKIIDTKTSSLNAVCDEPLPLNLKKSQVFLSAADLIHHMKTRPTPANIARNTMLLFGEPTSQKIPSIQQVSREKTLIVDVPISDLAFCLNHLAHYHFNQQPNSSGEKRICSFETYDIARNIIKHNGDSPHTQALSQALNIISKRDITQEECTALFQPKGWVVAIDRQQQPCRADIQQVKDIMKNHSQQEILLWKEGMSEWKNALTLTEFAPILPPLPQIFQNIDALRGEKKIHKILNL